MLPTAVTDAFQTLAARLPSPGMTEALLEYWRTSLHDGHVALPSDVRSAADVLERTLPGFTRSTHGVAELSKLFSHPSGVVLLAWCAASVTRSDTRIAPLLTAAAADEMQHGLVPTVARARVLEGPLVDALQCAPLAGRSRVARRSRLRAGQGAARHPRVGSGRERAPAPGARLVALGLRGDLRTARRTARAWNPPRSRARRALPRELRAWHPRSRRRGRGSHAACAAAAALAPRAPRVGPRGARRGTLRGRARRARRHAPRLASKRVCAPASAGDDGLRVAGRRAAQGARGRARGHRRQPQRERRGPRRRGRRDAVPPLRSQRPLGSPLVAHPRGRRRRCRSARAGPRTRRAVAPWAAPDDHRGPAQAPARAGAAQSHELARRVAAMARRARGDRPDRRRRARPARPRAGAREPRSPRRAVRRRGGRRPRRALRRRPRRDLSRGSKSGAHGGFSAEEGRGSQRRRGHRALARAGAVGAAPGDGAVELSGARARPRRDVEPHRPRARSAARRGGEATPRERHRHRDAGRARSARDPPRELLARRVRRRARPRPGTRPDGASHLPVAAQGRGPRRRIA